MALGCLLAVTAEADSWLPAQRETHLSDDGQWRLTVDPRPITSPLGYFRDKVDGKDNAGALPGEHQTSAIGTMERKEGRKWRQVWREPLRNEVAPVEAVAIPGGGAATFDNWHSMGLGKHAVVIYDAKGRVLANHALVDFLPREYVRALPRSVSSLHWRGKPRASADGRLLTIPVVVPGTDDPEDGADEYGFVDVSFDLATGEALPLSGLVWERALRDARAERDRQIAEEEDARRRFISPLFAPTSGLETDWHLYLMDAFFRLSPDMESEYPKTTVLRAPDAPDYGESLQWLRDALTTDTRTSSTTMLFGSPSPENLAMVMSAEAASIEPGSLSGQTIYLALPDDLYAEVAAAFAHVAATLVQLDPAQGIPQRPERLQQLNATRDEADDW
jgi:hypothetical protein